MTVLLTLSTTHPPATDLALLLEKPLNDTLTFPLPWGAAHVFYPETSDERCTAALLLEVDPKRLAKEADKREGAASSLARYVDDRAYAASPLLGGAIAKVLSSAMRGTSRARQELADRAIPLVAHLPVVACGAGPEHIEAMFAPLGYRVDVDTIPHDPRLATEGASSLFAVTLEADVRVADLLTQLCVLIPVLDDEGVRRVGLDDLEPLVTMGKGWLDAHPERESITSRYLPAPRASKRAAIARLFTDEHTERRADEAEARLERPLSLAARRRQAVLGALLDARATRVLDLGCGDGELLDALANDKTFERVIGCDVSPRAIERTARRLSLDSMPEAKRARVELIQGSALYRDPRFAEVDAICLVEVIEHVDPRRLGQLARVVFGSARPRLVIVTTPNRDARFEDLRDGSLRHADHRFEWNRAELTEWCDAICGEHGYSAELRAIGEDDPEVGPPGQMAVFTRVEADR